MNRTRFIRSPRLMYLSVCAVLIASTAQAGALIFHVDVNTASLVGNAGVPFSLDFQLNGIGVNTVTLSNFTLLNGTPLTDATFGPSYLNGATGNLSSTVVLNDGANLLNEFFQGFSAGTTDISFNATLTENVVAPNPDAFSIAVLDKTANNILTNGPSNNLLLVNITSPALTLANVQTFRSTSPAGVTVTASPEPATLSICMAAGLIALGWRVRRRRVR